MGEPNPESHLDLLALDSVRFGEATPAEAAHVQACAACQAALEDVKGVARQVQGLYRKVGTVPPGRDRAILELARRELHRVKVRKLARPRLWWSAAAAALLVSAGVALWLPPGRDPRDIDRSGGVDIVDAYTLALRVRSGEPLDLRWDLNHDGVVDRKDAEVVAKESVSLARWTR